MLDRRSFVRALGGGAAWVLGGARPPRGPGIDARPTALYQQPDGRANLVRITVAGLDAPAARARLTDRRGALVGTAGLLPSPDSPVLRGEVWVPLSSPAEFQIEVEVARQRVAQQRVRLAPPRRWTLYWVPYTHLDVGGNDLPERALEAQRRNLDIALSHLSGGPAERPAPENALAVLSYLENRSSASGDALLQAMRDGKVGLPALYANLLTGLLDHETFARIVWPAGQLARQRGLVTAAAISSDVPGQPATFPTMLAASGIRFLASAVSSERAAPLLPPAEARVLNLPGTPYPQLFYWEGPDGGRVLHWRSTGWGDGDRLGFATGPEDIAQRISDWLIDHPVFGSADYPYDAALLLGARTGANAPWDESIAANLAEFGQRYAFPRIVVGRVDDFFRDMERRHGPRIPVRRGDTGVYREEGAGSAAREVAMFRAAQLAARAADAIGLWEQRWEDAKARADERREAWHDLLLFAEHTWGAANSGAEPESRQTVSQWAFKKRVLESAAAAVESQVATGLMRMGQATSPGPGRLVFNASAWPRGDVVRIPEGAGESLTWEGTELPSVDQSDGSALVVVPIVPALGYLALRRGTRDPRVPVDEGEALEAEAAGGGIHVRLDPATAAIASLVGPGGREQVRPDKWSGLNQLLYVRGTPPSLEITQAEVASVRRERLPGIGVRLIATRRLVGLDTLESTVTLYDALPWVDIENRFAKQETLSKEALYVAFPFAFTRPTAQVEVPLGRVTVERDQLPGSCRDWYCHTHWVSLTEGENGVVWSGPDTPLVTFNDIVRGTWRTTIEPDGTLFAWALHNYWSTNFPPQQGGSYRQRFRLSLLPAADAAEPVRRGWAASDPLWMSGPYDNATQGPLITKDRALFFADPGVLLLAAKPADDGEGIIVRLLDITGNARPVSLWPAAYRYVQARRTNLVEMNGDSLPVAADGRASVPLAAWGVSAVRLFTPREGLR